MRPCLTCGTLCFSSRCQRCASDRRNSLYGAEHKLARQQWSPVVALGSVACRRCGQLIDPAQAWDVGHRAGQASMPEHAQCNRSAGGALNG